MSALLKQCLGKRRIDNLDYLNVELEKWHTDRINRQKGVWNPKLDPATNRYSVNFSSEEDMRFLKMYDRSGMTSKSAFIKARIFGEPFHVVTFDKSQHEYYAKFFAVQSG